MLVTSAACGSSDDDGDRPEATGSRSASASASASPSPSPSPLPPPQQLPRGGRTLFPDHFMVAHFGSAGARALGILGKGSPDAAAARLQREADTYQAVTTRKVIPAFDFIATIADAAPGKDGDYSAEVQPEEVQRYLDAARRAKMLLILDFQPGKADVLKQVQRYERFLLQPDVGVALDPEWVLPPEKKRFNDIGRMDAVTINNVSSYLANLTLKNRLPEKLFMLHQFRVAMLPQRELIVDRPGLATVIHSDGHGDRKTKLKVYDVLATTPPLGKGMTMGIKIFPKHPDVPKARLKYTDTNIFGPAEVLGLQPQPDMVSIQ
jgi:hypothetical protein